MMPEENDELPPLKLPSLGDFGSPLLEPGMAARLEATFTGEEQSQPGKLRRATAEELGITPISAELQKLEEIRILTDEIKSAINNLTQVLASGGHE